MKVIQLNQYVKLHDGERIFYCKYEYLHQACEDIKRKNHDVVLIVGGSDMCIYDRHLHFIPNNVRKLFVQNCLIDKSRWGDLVQPVPRGIEVSEAVNLGPYSWCGAEKEGEEKRAILSNPPEKSPTRLVYANFRIYTNLHHRVQIRDAAIRIPHITWSEPYGINDFQRYKDGPSYMSFVEEILDHKAVLCAQGNDLGGNLRMYETLYLSRVPITFNPVLYDNLHYIFPVVLVRSMPELEDREGLMKRVDEAKEQMLKNKKYLDFDYWKDMILEEANKA